MFVKFVLNILTSVANVSADALFERADNFPRRARGIVMSRGWVHYDHHAPEANGSERNIRWSGKKQRKRSFWRDVSGPLGAFRLKRLQISSSSAES